MEEVKISVRNLVEFILRSGDINTGNGMANQKEAMQAGGRLHRKLQRRMGAEYQAEVPLKISYEYPAYTLVIEGRADGILEKAQGAEVKTQEPESKPSVTIDEIKGIYQDVTSLEEPISIHLAQAKCYAYIYGSQKGLEEIGVQMTYCNLDTEELQYFRHEYTVKELEEWFTKLVEVYRKWADFQFEARIRRQESIQGLEFPFPYREGQKELVAGVYRTIIRQKNLFIQAPTGTGKTISTVFPAIKAVGEGHGDKIFYLTAKTITRTVAWEAFSLMRQHGYAGSVLIITAKEKLCLCQEMECKADVCPYAKGHYDRVNDAVFEMIGQEQEITREVLLAQAEKWKVCPFEMCLDASLWIDNIICDYNYVFDPNVYLKRFFGESARGDYIFLVDEAHNLVERGREMYSASLYKESFLEMKRYFRTWQTRVSYPEEKKLLSRLIKELEKGNRSLLEMKRECETYQEIDTIGSMIFSLLNLAAVMEECLSKFRELPDRDSVLEFYFDLRHFLNMYDLLDDHYVIYTQHQEDGRFQLKLYCVNPAANLQACLDKGRSAVFFSATLLPIQYYKSLLSTLEDNYAVYAQSVFAREQSKILVARDVSSKYTRRTREEFGRMADYILTAVTVKKGNYLIFLPSYQMLEQVWEACMEREPTGMEFLRQIPGMKEGQREEFLRAFGAERDNSLVGFCVMGGVFGEGIDLKEEQLIGAIIVGTGIPQISNEREVLKNYYDRKGESGFDYAFRYPGMNKVMQAAGRVIRTVEDRGVILLLDQRFLQSEYVGLFPREWQDYQPCTRDQAEALLRAYWENEKEDI